MVLQYPKQNKHIKVLFLIAASAQYVPFIYNPEDGTKLFSVSADKTAQMWDLGANTFVQVGAHDAPIKTAHYIDAPSYKVLMTGSWDKRLRFWDLRQPQPAMSLDLPERVYCADVIYPLAVVGTANRGVLLYNLDPSPTQHSQHESQCKHQTRCVSIFKDKQKQQPNGYALGSIEGRVAIQYLNPPNPKDNFTFKCHRTVPPVNNEVEIYAVNDMAFHPEHQTLATVGSDGKHTFWDKDARTKLVSSIDLGQAITACTIDPKGQVFCYALGYDWAKGHQFAAQTKPVRICMCLCYDGMKSNAKKS